MYGYGYQYGKIFGGGGLPFTPPLDVYTGAAAAYSLRLLRTAYAGSAIRVRRSSDNTEQDIGFLSGALDTASLLIFCGAGDGFVTTWYDQSGNSNNATQTTAASQPQIVSSGSTILENTKPTIDFDGIDDGFSMPSTVTEDHSIFSVSNNKGITGALYATTGGGYYMRHAFGKILVWYVPDTTNTVISILSGADNIQILASAIKESGTKYLQFNNVTEVSSASVGALSTKPLLIGNYVGAPFAGVMQELIIYASGKYNVKNGIKSNINSYYGIY